MKDVTTSGLSGIQVEFEPAIVKIDREWVEKQIQAIAVQYEDYVVTAETYKADYAERTRLNEVKEKLERQRKEINSVISEPYKDFKSWYDQATKPLDAVIMKITEGLNAVDAHELTLRLSVVQNVFEELCENIGLKAESFEGIYSNYGLKKYFKPGKYELKQSTLDEISLMVLNEKKAIDEFNSAKQVIVSQATSYGLPENVYIRQLEDGKGLAEILGIINADKNAMDERKMQQEINAKAEAERLAEIERIAKENVNEQIKAFNADTGEVLDCGTNTFGQERNCTEGKIEGNADELTFDLRLTFPEGLEQVKKFKVWLAENGIGWEQL
ncbi:TPA: DUF1351 domain-containing protein [Streptococcus suis]|nr:DUF1351 domain-containing protein [Streptococcus suis]